MNDVIYEKMVSAIGSRGGGMPSIRCKEFDALVDAVFSEEEAEMYLRMPDGLVSVEEMAALSGMDAVQVRRILECMTDNGTVMGIKRDGKQYYLAMSLLPGIYEFHFHKNSEGEKARASARIFRDYRDTVERMQVNKPGIFPSVPWARVIPLNIDITSKIQINTYDQVRQYIDKAKNFAVARCFCRIIGNLLDDPCDKPIEVCLAIGPGAINMAERGFGRLVSREQALEIVKKADEAGLVHCSSNTSRYIDFICNCCTCHCYLLRNIKNDRIPSFVATSSLLADIDVDSCVGCGECVDRCPMQAISVREDFAAVDESRCIGCGLCIATCPADSIILHTRPDCPAPPYDMKILNEKILDSIKTEPKNVR